MGEAISEKVADHFQEKQTACICSLCASEHHELSTKFDVMHIFVRILKLSRDP